MHLIQSSAPRLRPSNSHQTLYNPLPSSAPWLRPSNSHQKLCSPSLSLPLKLHNSRPSISTDLGSVLPPPRPLHWPTLEPMPVGYRRQSQSTPPSVANVVTPHTNKTIATSHFTTIATVMPLVVASTTLLVAASTVFAAAIAAAAAQRSASGCQQPRGV